MNVPRATTLLVPVLLLAGTDFIVLQLGSPLLNTTLLPPFYKGNAKVVEYEEALGEEVFMTRQ